MPLMPNKFEHREDLEEIEAGKPRPMVASPTLRYGQPMALYRLQCGIGAGQGES